MPIRKHNTRYTFLPHEESFYESSSSDSEASLAEYEQISRSSSMMLGPYLETLQGLQSGYRESEGMKEVVKNGLERVDLQLRERANIQEAIHEDPADQADDYWSFQDEEDEDMEGTSEEMDFEPYSSEQPEEMSGLKILQDEVFRQLLLNTSEQDLTDTIPRAKRSHEALVWMHNIAMASWLREPTVPVRDRGIIEPEDHNQEDLETGIM